MAQKYNNVIVYGPTGAVGSIVAKEAAKRGAKVWLAMRDTSKTVPGLDEKSGNYERVTADLTDPASIKSAVEKSGAKAAYFYQVRTQDGMKATVQAMKDGGIEYVVFLSSFSILPDRDLKSVEPAEIIPFAHSSVEVTIGEVGLPSTMLRPGAFAYNTLWQNIDQSTESWTANIPKSDRRLDGIVPKDIGHVGGATLVNRPSEGHKQVVYLYGTQLMTKEEQISAIENVVGKKIQTKVLGDEDYKKYLMGKGFPQAIADYLVKAEHSSSIDASYGNGRHEEGTSNIKKYSGYEATTFEEYIRERFAEEAR